LQLFSSVTLPVSTLSSLRHMYERFDGQGLPDGLRSKDIPLGARVLAMADTFADLTSNPRNPYRRILGTEEAMKVLANAKERVFDPNLVDLFGVVVAGDDLKRQLLTGAQTVLLVDSDPEQSAILDLQLTSRGFKVRCVQSVEQALKAINEARPNIILSEVDLEPVDGFELKGRLNQNEATGTIPFIYFTTRAASADVEKGFNLGAQDYLVKPSSVDIVAAKIHKTLEEKPGAAAGVSGSLSDMSLPDLVQILAHGRKNGQLKLKMAQHRGEIHFMNGDVYNALFDRLRGEEAFFEMLKFKEGTFSLNPNFKAESKVIQMTAEMLLLEGMRRMDEESR
jgi:response regulator RpfG family c-di-GMP phosphodiesterase